MNISSVWWLHTLLIVQTNKFVKNIYEKMSIQCSFKFTHIIYADLAKRFMDLGKLNFPMVFRF